MADVTAGSVKSKKKKKIRIFPIVNGIIMALFVIIIRMMMIFLTKSLRIISQPTIC